MGKGLQKYTKPLAMGELMENNGKYKNIYLKQSVKLSAR
jgi:hypothetical protein